MTTSTKWLATRHEAGKKAAETNKYRHGKDFYARIGRMGGLKGTTGGFAANPELAKIAGRKGGLKSSRGFQYQYKFTQIREFDPKACGYEKGYQLRNIGMGFHVRPFYPSCMADAKAQKRAHTLHPLKTLPKDVTVPIYIDSGSPFGYMVVSIKGKIFDPLKKYRTLKGVNVLGWGESIDNVKVVKLERIKDETTQ